MAKPKGKGASGKGISKTGTGKKRKADTALERETGEDEFFLASDQEQDDAGDDQAVEETAEQKRLRLAKAYIARMRQDEPTGGLDEDEGHAALSERLQQQALEAMGRVQRKIAARVVLPDPRREDSAGANTNGRFTRCHQLPVTALAVTSDDATSFSVSKDGSIFRMDIETGARSRLDTKGPQVSAKGTSNSSGPDWVKRGPRQAGYRALLAAAVSDDGRYLAVGGGDWRVHVWDARSNEYIQGFTGHRDIVSGLAFRGGTHELCSASFDRSIKLWSLDDRTAMDTLLGHQAEVLCIDMLRQERAVTGGHDHSCRVWKIPEETQLVCRTHAPAVDCIRYITATQWLSGASDGSLSVWSQLKKRPVSTVKQAHAASAADVSGGAAAPDSDAASWVQSVAACRGSDLVASGAGDGLIRLWEVGEGKSGAQGLSPLGGLPARGFANALHIAKSGRFVLAGMGQEPRLGRWARDKSAKNGLLLHMLELAEHLPSDNSAEE